MPGSANDGNGAAGDRGAWAATGPNAAAVHTKTAATDANANFFITLPRGKRSDHSARAGRGLRISDVLAVDRLILVGHPERGATGNQHVRDRLDRHGNAHAGHPLVVARDVDAPGPERRRLR